MSTSPPTSWYRKIYHKDNYRCVYCGKNMLNELDSWLSIEIDHIIPQGAGGTNDSSNLVTSCHICNKYKSDHLSKKYNGDMLALKNSIKRNEILNEIRNHILNKRLIHQIRWIEAQNDFDSNTIKDMDDSGNTHY